MFLLRFSSLFGGLNLDLYVPPCAFDSLAVLLFEVGWWPQALIWNLSAVRLALETHTLFCSCDAHFAVLSACAWAIAAAQEQRACGLVAQTNRFVHTAAFCGLFLCVASAVAKPQKADSCFQSWLDGGRTGNRPIDPGGCVFLLVCLQCLWARVDEPTEPWPIYSSTLICLIIWKTAISQTAIIITHPYINKYNKQIKHACTCTCKVKHKQASSMQANK